jgi:hypothetical protein
MAAADFELGEVLGERVGIVQTVEGHVRHLALRATLSPTLARVSV